MLKTKPQMEALIAGQEPLYSHVDPAREAGKPGLLKRVYRVRGLGNVEVNMGDLDFEWIEGKDGAPTYFLTIVGRDETRGKGGANVHLVSGLRPEHLHGQVLVTAELRLRTWEPENGEGYRNYALVLELAPMSVGVQTKFRLDVESADLQTTFVDEDTLVQNGARIRLSDIHAPSQQGRQVFPAQARPAPAAPPRPPQGPFNGLHVSGGNRSGGSSGGRNRW